MACRGIPVTKISQRISGAQPCANHAMTYRCPSIHASVPSSVRHRQGPCFPWCAQKRIPAPSCLHAYLKNIYYMGTYLSLIPTCKQGTNHPWRLSAPLPTNSLSPSSVRGPKRFVTSGQRVLCKMRPVECTPHWP